MAGANRPGPCQCDWLPRTTGETLGRRCCPHPLMTTRNVKMRIAGCCSGPSQRVNMGGIRFSVWYRGPKGPSGHGRFRSIPFPHRHGPTGREPRQCYVLSAPIVAVQKICPVSPEQSLIGAAGSGWVGWKPVSQLAEYLAPKPDMRFKAGSGRNPTGGSCSLCAGCRQLFKPLDDRRWDGALRCRLRGESLTGSCLVQAR
jgi:hypothetical protein